VIARDRGDMREHSRWRPQPAAPMHQAPTPDLAGVELAEPAPLELQAKRRGSRLLIAVGAVLVLAAITGQQHARRPASTVALLPATPRQWVDQWSGAALEDPGRVCGQLFAPQLARAFKTDTGRSCSWYFSSVKSVSFRIRHVLQDGGTAAVEAQELGAGRRWGYFTMLLSHVAGGWQAVDVVPGGSVRPR
jgi:hypothetical protein